MSPITREDFEKAKKKLDTHDELTGEILKFLRIDYTLAYSTKELCDHFKVDDTDVVLTRCKRLMKEKLVDGFKPKHSRMYYWIARRIIGVKSEGSDKDVRKTSNRKSKRTGDRRRKTKGVQNNVEVSEAG